MIRFWQRIPAMTRRFAARRSPIHGKGVFALQAIGAGEELLQYRGRLLSHDEADDLYADNTDSGHTFLFTLNDDYIVDANVGGNTARWLNHSCDPNCEAVIVEDADGDPRGDRVVICTLRAIRPGEELTYNYGIRLDEAHTLRMKKIWACHCGAANCSGTMLQPKRK